MARLVPVELPSELADALHEKMAAMTAAFNEPCTNLSQSPGGRDILDAVSAVGPRIASRLARFSAVLGSNVYTSRMLCFIRAGKANKARWQPRRLAVASPDFLAGSPARLRDLCNEIAASETNAYVNLWVQAVPEKGPTVFFVLIRHKDGAEAVFSVIDECWKQINVGPAAVDIILTDMLQMDNYSKDKWVALLKDGMERANADLKPELDPIFKKWGVAEVSDEQWGELLQAMFVRQGYLDAIVSAGRHLTAPLMHESQNLLEALTHITKLGQEELDRRLTQLERDHGRALKRLKADLDKANMMLTGAYARNRTLAKDVGLLQGRLNQQPTAAVPASADPQPQADMPLAVALDQFFD